jgi:CelD/BcsL family acetyltransferase involved in cellulose biosynthesis
VAFDYGVFYGGSYYLLQTSYKEKWQEYYPGSVLRKLIIERLYRDLAREIDFGPGEHIWKAKWTQTTREYVQYVVFNRNIKSQYLYWSGKLAERLRSYRRPVSE